MNSEWFEAGRAARAADPRPVNRVGVRKAAVILRRHLKVETGGAAPTDPGVTSSPVSLVPPDAA